jgi:hypothetical protein
LSITSLFSVLVLLVFSLPQEKETK